MIEIITLVAILTLVPTIFIVNYISWKKGKAVLRDYYVAGGVMRALILLAATLGTAYSSFTFLGGPGYIYRKGIGGFIILSGIGCITFISMTLIGKHLWALSHKYNYITVADFVYDRFPSKATRLLVSLICIVFPIFYITVQLMGSAYIASVLTNNLLPYEASIIIFAAFLGIYIFLGGQRGVIWSDAIMTVVFAVTLWIIAGYSVSLVGLDIFTKVYNINPDLFVVRNPISVATVTIGSALSLIAWPHLTLFYYAAKDRRAVFSIGFAEEFGEVFLLGLCSVLIGFAGVILYPNLPPAETDKITLYISQGVPALIPLVAVGGICAALTTADSIIITSSAIITKDIYKDLVNPRIGEEKATLVGRILALTIAIISAIIALRPPGPIVDIVINLSWSGVLLLTPIFFAALYWKRATTTGVIASLIMGLIAVIVTTYVWVEPFDIYSGIWGLIFEVPTLIIVSFMTAPPTQEIIKKFYT
ncbi:MAG: sodium:solute symporter family protein [Sulfolobales archaeon]